MNKPKKDVSLTAPDLKTATPMIKSNAFTKNAAVNWMFESHVVNLIVRLMSSSLAWSSSRVCEIDEWRYKLCGITVAPMIPNAPVNGVSPLIDG